MPTSLTSSLPTLLSAIGLVPALPSAPCYIGQSNPPFLVEEEDTGTPHAGTKNATAYTYDTSKTFHERKAAENELLMVR